MTVTQGLLFAILGGAILCFASGRFRLDVVSLVALFIGLALGVVPLKTAFGGFTSDVVVIIASALVVSAAVARSGIIEWAVQPLAARLERPATQVPVIVGATGLLSMVTKNVGALAILMPVALRMGRGKTSSPTALLMPMSFISLLGGLVTLVGTSTNIIASQVRQDMLGKPFRMYDFAPVGLALTGLGFLYLSFAWRLLPHHRQARTDLGEITAETAYSTEVKLADSLPTDLRTVADLKLDDDDVKALGIVLPDGTRRPVSDAPLVPGASLILEGDDAALDRVFARLPLTAERTKEAVRKDNPTEETRTIEAVVQPGSRLIGQTAQRAHMQDRYGVQLMGIGRNRERITQRLRDVQFRAGDMLVLRAGETSFPEMMGDMGILPLAERSVKLGDRRGRWLPISILAIAMILLATGAVPVVTAFFGAAVLMIVIGGLSPREAYGSLEPEVLILIGALTPISEALRAAGGTDLLVGLIASHLHGMPSILVVGALMTLAMACSPFLHNAPTVLVLAPIAIGIANGLHLAPDPLLMAVATGAGCDFLTPVGHQCNTLVMGPGGYRFGDYWRLGFPLSMLVIVVGTPLIAWVWHL